MATDIYIRSPNLDERMLSTLIILKTILRGNCAYALCTSIACETEGYKDHNADTLYVLTMRPNGRAKNA